jgi:DNA-binding transcriptional LysR family regulator
MRHLVTYRYVDEVAKAGSIRGAAETLAITPSALNRRILALEEELGVQIFERLPRGVRLSTAGELLVHHIRLQISDMERVRSQIADLSGVRRGNVAVACSQALLPYFLPEQIEIYRRDHPAVTFGVFVRDREAAENALMDYSADVALVFEPVKLADFHTLLSVQQPIHAVMSSDHPLARQKQVRLSECLEFPCALPALPYGVRSLIEAAAKRYSIRLSPEIQSDSFDFLRSIAGKENFVSFQIRIGLPRENVHDGMTHRPVDPRDLPPGQLQLAHLRGRTLPVAAARFADQLARTFVADYECE